MKVFLSYPKEQRKIADQINLALLAQGYDVFFDRDKLPPGDDYNAAIHRELMESELLVFLVTPGSVKQGKYTMTELKFARQKWPSPVGRILPVMVSPTDFEIIPDYLAAVTIEEARGNVAAEVVARVNEMRAPAEPATAATPTQLEDVVRWGVEATRLASCIPMEILLFKVRSGYFSAPWESLRMRILSPEQYRAHLHKFSNRLGIAHRGPFEPLPENFDAEFDDDEEEGSYAVYDAIETCYKDSVGPVTGELLGRDARLRQACTLGVAIGSIDSMILDNGVALAKYAKDDKKVKTGALYGGRFAIWRAQRKTNRLNTAITRGALQGRFRLAEEAAEKLSVPRGWTKGFSLSDREYDQGHVQQKPAETSRRTCHCEIPGSVHLDAHGL